MYVSNLALRDRQGRAERIPEPTTRAHLLEVVRQKPAAKPAAPAARPEFPLLDVAAWQRRSRGVRAQQALRAIALDTVCVASALGVTPRCVSYWKSGAHAPTRKHSAQLSALRYLAHLIRSNRT